MSASPRESTNKRSTPTLGRIFSTDSSSVDKGQSSKPVEQIPEFLRERACSSKRFLGGDVGPMRKAKGSSRRISQSISALSEATCSAERVAWDAG